MERRESAQKEAGIQRAEQVAERLALAGQSFDIGGRVGGLIVAILLTAIPAGIFCFALEAPSGVMLLVGGLTAVVAFFAWVAVLPNLTAAPMSLTPAGMKTALYGFIPWEEVGGLDLFTTRGLHEIEFSVPNLEALRSQMHPCERIHRLFAFGSAGVLRFRFSRADAMFAHDLASLLWQQRTGRTNSWVARNPRLTAELREEHAFLDRLNRPDVRANPEKALELLKQHRDRQKHRR
jgi:hypothetical protein